MLGARASGLATAELHHQLGHDRDGCGAELAWWLSDEPWQPSNQPPPEPLRLADLPAECRDMLEGR